MERNEEGEELGGSRNGGGDGDTREGSDEGERKVEL